mgnify:CR=1 FL=1
MKRPLALCLLLLSLLGSAGGVWVLVLVLAIAAMKTLRDSRLPDRT